MWVCAGGAGQCYRGSDGFVVVVVEVDGDDR